MELTEQKMQRLGKEIMSAVVGMEKYVIPHLQNADIIAHDTSLLSKALDLIIDMHKYIEKHACKLVARGVKTVLYDKRGWVRENATLMNAKGKVLAKLHVQNAKFKSKYRVSRDENHIYVYFDEPVDIYVIYLGTEGTLIDVPCSKYVKEGLKEADRMLREVMR